MQAPPEPGHGTDVSDDEALSASLLALYRAAWQSDIGAFQSAALCHLQQHVSFDGSVWGAGIHGEATLNHAHVWQVDAGILEWINADPQHNIVPRRCAAALGVAQVFDGELLRSNPPAAWLLERYGFEQLMCIVTVDPVSRLLGSLGLLRRQAQPPFGERDCRWLGLLMPHLQEMLNLSRLTQLHESRGRRLPEQERMAVTDARGVLHIMEPGFASMMREVWPDWVGPRLPAGLLAGVEPCLAQGPLQICIEGVAEKLLVRLRRRSPADRLSPQERAVATAYAHGQSHKEVARALGLAPATVRHHLRSIYAKLGVDDKAALAQRLGQPLPAD